jgi:hypothetical protein
MRIVAAIYLTIMLVNFGIWATSTSGTAVLSSSHAYVIWTLYAFSVLALLAFVLRVRILPRKAWQVVFVVYLVYRLAELASTGLALNGGNIVADLNTLASYLWLVLPAGMAMGYLGFMPSEPLPHRGHTASMELTSPER